MTSSRLSVGEFAFPGPLRDQLVAAILSGAKTTTSGLLIGYQRDNEPLPRPGDRWVVIDSAGDPVTLIEVTGVRVLRLADVDLAHAVGEGEGFASVAAWRAGHEAFWHSAEVRADLGDPAFTVTDDTLIVAEEFRLVTGEHPDLTDLLRRARAT
ncbi:MAG TPA: ASCH domain-containing protein [Trebonia sp.]|nr:ASCH domain-containing protein [Trebonia sp.]